MFAPRSKSSADTVLLLAIHISGTALSTTGYFLAFPLLSFTTKRPLSLPQKEPIDHNIAVFLNQLNFSDDKSEVFCNQPKEKSF
jgi:hypothetical protein